MKSINCVYVPFKLPLWHLRKSLSNFLHKATRHLKLFDGAQPIHLARLFPVLDRLFMDINAERSDGYEFEIFFALLQIMMDVDCSLCGQIVQRYFKYIPHIETNVDSILRSQIHRKNLHQYYAQVSFMQKEFYRNVAIQIPTSGDSDFPLDDIRIPQQRICNSTLLSKNVKRWRSLKSVFNFAMNFDAYTEDFERVMICIFKDIDFGMKSWYDAIFYIFEDSKFKAMVYGAECKDEFIAVCLIVEQMLARQPEFIECIWSQYGSLILNYFRDEQIRFEILHNSNAYSGIISLLSKLASYALTANAATENPFLLSSHCYWLSKKDFVSSRSCRCSKWNAIALLLVSMILAVGLIGFALIDPNAISNHFHAACAIYSGFMIVAIWSGFKIFKELLQSQELTNERIPRIQNDIHRLTALVESISESAMAPRDLQQSF